MSSMLLLELETLQASRPEWASSVLGQGFASPSVAVVELSRPEALNALSTQALKDIEEAFLVLQRKYVPKGLKVVVIRAAGRGFSAGADLKERPRQLPDFKSADPEHLQSFFKEWRIDSQLGKRAMDAIANLEAFTICGVHGFALGGGWCISLASDMTMATRNTFFQMPEININLPLTWACTPRLAATVGAARAKEIIALGQRFSAEELHSIGAISRVCQDEAALNEEIFTVAKVLMEKDPLALHIFKTQFRALEKRNFLGDISESDGDHLVLPLLIKQLSRSNKL